jgi:hypothetical protein
LDPVDRITTRHADIRGKRGYIWAFTPIAVILYADVFVHKTASCSETVFRKKVL